MKKVAFLSLSTKLILFSILFVQIRTDAMSQINKIASLGAKSLLNIYLRSQKSNLNNSFEKGIAHYCIRLDQPIKTNLQDELDHQVQALNKLKTLQCKYNWSNDEIQKLLSCLNKLSDQTRKHVIDFEIWRNWQADTYGQNFNITLRLPLYDVYILDESRKLLHTAIKKRKLESVKAILESDVGNCLLDVLDEKEMTPLLLAAQLPNEEIFKKLVKHGADKSQILKISKKCIKNNTALRLFNKLFFEYPL